MTKLSRLVVITTKRNPDKKTVRFATIQKRDRPDFGCSLYRQWHLPSPFLLTFRLTGMENQFFVLKAFLS